MEEKRDAVSETLSSCRRCKHATSGKEGGSKSCDQVEMGK
jgi:hypothetical protein